MSEPGPPRKRPRAEDAGEAAAPWLLVTMGEVMLRFAPLDGDGAPAPASQTRHRPQKFLRSLGGDELNVAVALAQIGVRSRWVSVVPTGPLGDIVMESCAEHNVEFRGARTEGDLGIFTVLPEEKAVHYQRRNSVFAKHDPQLLAWDKLLGPDVDGSQGGAAPRIWLHVTGITPLVSPNARQSWDAAIEQAKRQGTPISMDLNHRKQLGSLEQLWGMVAPHVAHLEVLVLSEEQLLGLCQLHGLQVQPLLLQEGDEHEDDEKLLQAMAALQARCGGCRRIALCRKRRLACGTQRRWSLLTALPAAGASAPTFWSTGAAPLWHRPKDELGGGSAWMAGLLEGLALGRGVTGPAAPVGSAGIDRPVADPKIAFLSLVTAVPWGVLGTQLTRDKKEATRAPGPDLETAFVDPAGLVYIQEKGPGKAGGAAGAIYRFLGIQDDAAFPQEVVAGVRKELDAKLHAYSSTRVIHAVGPDFRSAPYAEGEQQLAVEALTSVYCNVLREYVASGLRRLRLLPLSGGIFSGRYASALPTMTAAALSAAFERLDARQQQHILASSCVELCIFLEQEFCGYASAMRGVLLPIGDDMRPVLRRADLLAALCQESEGDFSRVTGTVLDAATRRFPVGVEARLDDFVVAAAVAAEEAAPPAPAPPAEEAARRVEGTLARLRSAGVIAILRAKGSPEVAIRRAVELAELGCRAIEVTMDSSEWPAVLGQLRKALPPDVVLGIGTVMDDTVCEIGRAAALGASFALSPIDPLGFVEECQRRGVLAVPSGFTSNECWRLHCRGARLIKLFHAGTVSPAILKSMLDVTPLSAMNILPSGGVSPGNAQAWWDAGAAVVGMGSNLVGRDVSLEPGTAAFEAAAKTWESTERDAARRLFAAAAARCGAAASLR